MTTRNRPTFFIKTTDTRPHLDVALSDDQGRAVDVTTSTITFSMRNTLDNSVKVDTVVASTLNARRGEVRHSWTALQTGEVGEYEGEFVVTDSAGRVQTYPSDGFLIIIVGERV